MISDIRLGKYILHEELGRGGFGTVYRAFNTVLEVERAVKILHPALIADPEFIGRFRREAKLAARLEHPHIVPVYDLDEYQGRYFLAMRYMPGGSLKTLLEKQGPLPFPRALEILKQIAAALEYAHGRKLIHRDIKPQNILFDNEGNACLTDFGFAKSLAAADSSTSLSRSGSAVGTPAYMSPEAWDGQGWTPAADIYSLACVFYEMLTGKVLFDAETPTQAMKQHVIEGARFPEAWPVEMPEGSIAVLQKALAMEPQDRYPDMAALAEALEGLTAPAHTPAPLPKTGEGEGLRAKPAWLPIMGLVLLLGIGLAVGGGLLSLGQKGFGPLAGLVGHIPSPLPTMSPMPTKSIPTNTLPPTRALTPTITLSALSTRFPMPTNAISETTIAQIAKLATLKLGIDMFDVTFSSDGKRLSAYSFKDVYVYDLEKQVVISQFTTSEAIVDFAASDQTLVAGTADGKIQLRRIDGSMLASFTLPGSVLERSLTISMDDKLLAAGLDDGSITLWSIEERAQVVNLPACGSNQFPRLAFSGKNYLVSVCDKITLWNANTGGLAELFSESAQWGEIALFSEEIVTFDGAEARYWLIYNNQLYYMFNYTANIPDGVSVGLSWDGALVAFGGLGGQVEIRDHPGGMVLTTLYIGNKIVRGIAFSPDKRLLALALDDGTIQLWGVP